MENNMLYLLFAIILLVIIAIVIINMVLKKRRISGSIHNQIYVGNLPYRVNEYDLKKFFEKFGQVIDARVVKHNKTGRSKGYAFVTFSDAKMAKRALTMHGKDLRGRTMVVRIAKPPKKAEQH